MPELPGGFVLVRMRQGFQNEAMANHGIPALDIGSNRKSSDIAMGPEGQCCLRLDAFDLCTKVRRSMGQEHALGARQ